MNIYSESEVILIAGEEALKAYREEKSKPPFYPFILKKDDVINLCYYDGMIPWPGTVLKTHIASSDVTYDLIINFPNGNKERFYNVQAAYVKPVFFGDGKLYDEVSFTENN